MNNLIAPEIVAKCMDPVEQEKIDQLMVSFLSLLHFKFDLLQLTMDGTDNKNKFGANAILGVSMAVAKVTTTALKYKLGRNYWHRTGGVNSDLFAPHILDLPLLTPHPRYQ